MNTPQDRTVYTKCPKCLAHFTGTHTCDPLMKALVGLKIPVAKVVNGKDGLYLILNGEDDCAWAVKEEELEPIKKAIEEYLSKPMSNIPVVTQEIVDNAHKLAKEEMDQKLSNKN